jgi:hypothetical protein
MSAITPRVDVVLVALLVTCGSVAEKPPAAARADVAAADDDHPPRDLGAVDLCALIQPERTLQRYGKVIDGPTQTRDPNGRPTCSFVLAPNTGVIVELIDAWLYDAQHNVWESGKVEDISGVGEKAFVVKLKPPSDPHLIAARGEVAVKVTTRNLDLAQEVARGVLAGL